MASCRARAGTVVRVRVGSAEGAARAGVAASPRRSPTAGGVRPRFAEPPPILPLPSGPIAHSALVPKRRRQACERVRRAFVARRDSSKNAFTWSCAFALASAQRRGSRAVIEHLLEQQSHAPG